MPPPMHLQHLLQMAVSKYSQKDLPVKSFHYPRNSMLPRPPYRDFFDKSPCEYVVPHATLLPAQNWLNPCPVGLIEIPAFGEDPQTIYRISHLSLLNQHNN